MESMEFIGSALLVALAVLVVFFITREFWCWYWKINEQIVLQKEIILLLRAAPRTPSAPAGANPGLSAASASGPTSDSVNPLVAIPDALSGAYLTWLESRGESDYMVFLTVLNNSKHTFPTDTTAEQLILTFPEIAARVNFAEVLATRGTDRRAR